MSFGRACGVHSNPNHEAFCFPVQGVAVEAYRSCLPLSGAACGTQDDEFDFLLPFRHSIWHESAFLHPFDAAINACSLRWEVLQDLSHVGAFFLDPKPFVSGSSHKLSSCISQKAHSKHVGCAVRFEDYIDVLLGDEDSDLYGFRMKHDWLHDWDDKPWSKNRITSLPRPLPAAFSNDELSIGFYVPQFISGFPHHDDVSFMQLPFERSVTCKQDDFQPRETALQSSLQHGMADFVMQALQDEGSSGSSEPVESFDNQPDMPQPLSPSSVSSNRQDVIIYHLHDDPIRAFLDWSSYESMVTEVAHHFAVHRQGIIDAYEIVAPLRDLPPDVTPIIAHLLNDIPVGHVARLVLFDLELHGHKIEPHFRLGPSTERFVMPVPERTDRNGILVLADVDKYCKAESGRCLVFHNTLRWPDHDLSIRQFAHGDTIRIALPPSDRFECPTDQLVTWTQQDLTDIDILHQMGQGSPAEGYSPSLLGDEDARALAAPSTLHARDEESEVDNFHAMQRQLSVSAVGSESSEHSSDSSLISPDWFIDLQRIVNRHVSSCDADRQDEVLFSVYTWLLNHENRRLCNAPKIAVLGGDPSEWREDIISPWRFHIDPNHETFIDVVSPHSPRADIEEHIAHVIITQKPTVFSSALLSLDFLDPNARSVILRFAMAVPRVCTPGEIAEVVPYFASIAEARLSWVHPASFTSDHTFQVHNGMGILINVEPEDDHEDAPGNIEDFSVLQTSASIDAGSVVDPKAPEPSCSIMDELLEAINAANNAIEDQPTLLDPTSLDAQPAGTRDLWERLTDQLVLDDGDPTRHHRIESWLLDHRIGHHRCHSSRIVTVNENFISWRSSFVATWQDRLTDWDDFSLAIVHPESEDRAAGVFAQVIVTLHSMPELRSVLLSVYDSDPELERNPHTFAVVVPRQFDFDECLELLHLQSDCPPANLRNRCTLWFGAAPLVPNRQIVAQHGHAFRLVLCRGVRIEPPELLAMDSSMLQQMIQDALVCDIYARPPEPSFTQGLNRNLAGAPDNVLHSDIRPIWITELHHRFSQVFTVEAPDYTPFARIAAWYVNGEGAHICTAAREVRVTDDPTSWRTDIVFVWRDHLIRASAADFVTVQGLPLHPSTLATCPHVIMSQGLPNGQHPVLVTVQCIRHDAFPNRQFAFVFSASIAANDVARVSVPNAYHHLPFVVLIRGVAYLPGETFSIQSGNHLQVLVASPDVAPFSHQTVDGFSLLQMTVFDRHGLTQKPTSFLPHACKPAPFEEDNDLPMTFPGPDRTRPARPTHDGRIDWMNALVEAIRAHGIYDPWHGFTTLQVETWFVDHLHSPICRQSRGVRVTGEVITWIDDFRVAWADQLDPNAVFSIHLVRPAPPGPFHQISLPHFIVEQNRIAHRAAILVTSQFEGLSDEGFLQGAFSTPDRLELQRLIDIMGIGPHCHGRLCRIRFNHQTLPIGVEFDVLTGHSLQVKIEPFDDTAQLPLPPNFPALHDEADFLQRYVSLRERPKQQPSQVATWFLRQTAFPVCFKPRFAVLDVQHSLPEILRGVWFDIADDSDIAVVSVVHPITGDWHLIGAQTSHEPQIKAVLLEAGDDGCAGNLCEMRAALLADPLQVVDIGHVFGIDFNLTSGPQRRCCNFRVDGRVCDFSAPVACEDGMFIQFRWDSSFVAKLPLKVNFDAVVKVFDELDAHFILPVYDLPSEFPWHPQSWEWTQAPWWSPGMPCQELVLYYDGSCLNAKSEQAAGCAVAAFAKVSGIWHFAGAISTKLGCATSYVAELAAAILAHKFAFDLLKTICSTQCSSPWVEFRFDSLTVGSQSEGLWQTCSQPRMGNFLRCLHRCTEHRFHTTLHHAHIVAHSGEPGNELVDCLAFQAASGIALHDFQPWLRHVTSERFVQSAEWIWYLFRPDICWDQHEVVFPAAPCTTPDVSVFPAHFASVASPTTDQQGCLDIKLATCNVLSLKPAKNRDQALVQHLHHGPARQDALLMQFHEAGIHLFAWQETRIKYASNRHDSRYWIFRSPANAQGHYGIFIGIQRAIPIGHIIKDGHKEDVFIQAHEVSTIASSPRFLILRVRNPLLQCVLIAGHAPHTGADAATIASWWQSVSDAIPLKYRHWHMILLADANARVGAEPNARVGDHQAEGLDPKSEGFLEFLARHGLWIPATFSASQTGLGATWRHARGQWFRNDYVCIPSEWQLLACRSWVSEDIDVGLIKEDHRAAVVHVCRKLVPFGGLHMPKHNKLTLDNVDPSCLTGIDQPGWQLDVHTHTAMLQDSLVDTLWSNQSPPTCKPFKTTMTDLTWTMVQEKRACRNLLHERSRAQKLSLLQAWFSCWRHAICDCPLTEMHSAFDDLICEQDRLIAIEYWRFRSLGTQVAKAIRADDIQFYTSLLADCQDFLAPADAKRLWGVVRRSLPKFQQRKMHVAPFQLEALEDQWLSHYEELEAGVETSPQALVADCAFQQALRRIDAPLSLQVEDLPSLSQLEREFRSVPVGKASGYDPLPSALFHKAPSPVAAIYHDLIVKEFIWQCEPIQAKGGPIAILPKTLHPTTAKQFRGILLLPNAGKRAHAILRSHIMRALAPARSPGQLGGFAGQQVMFGSQALRVFGTICDCHGLSSAILFLDLSSAFHHLIREAVVGSVDGANLAPVLKVLQAGGEPIDKFHAFSNLPGILTELGVAEPIVRLLRDIHLGTWCTLHDRWLLRTHRGTRPGSPLADIIFHALMARVASAIDYWIQQQPGFASLFKELDVEVPTVVWADDIAVPLASKCANEIVPLLQRVLEQIRSTLKGYGFSLNFAKGKTSAVLTLTGPGAGDLRKKYLLHPRPGVQCLFEDGDSEWLHFTSSYRHLGTLFTSSHDLACELRARVGIAKSTFAQLAKPILVNKYMPVHLRLQFFHSLVATRLFFGLGAWSTPTPKQIQYVQSVLIGMLRRVLRIGHLHLPADQVLTMANSADVRVKLAVDRLLYAQRLFRTGPPFLHHLLHREFACVEGSWLHGLRADLAWMEAVNPNCLPSDWEADLTALFDLWQDPRSDWPRRVKRCLKLHLIQSAIMSDAKKLHGTVIRTLQKGGATFDQPGDCGAQLDESHVCFCSRAFDTRRGLLAHQRKAHKIFSAERPFLQGCTCLHCGKFLWSTQRLQQHLAYIPKSVGYNPCFAALTSQGRQVEYANVDEGKRSHFAGLQRRDALQVEGPQVNPMTTNEHRRLKLQTELAACYDKLHIPCVPEDEIKAGESLGAALEKVTLQWFKTFYPQGPTEDEKSKLTDAWIDVLYSCPDAFECNLDPWLERVFLLWGEHWLPDIVDTFEDGVAEHDVDELFAELASQLERYQLLARVAHLEAGILSCELPSPGPHRTNRVHSDLIKHPKICSRLQQTVGRPFAEQASWLRQVRGLTFLDLPETRPVPKLVMPDGRSAYLVLHLFSGRRREGDVHAQLHALAASRGIPVLVLSVDTAVSLEFGNLALGSSSWKAILQLYEAGVVAATLVGSPCETFSEARFVVPPDADPAHPGPRPLRSAEWLLGVEGLTIRELKQCHMGGNFFQQAAIALGHHMVQGGCFVSEHPARPHDPSRPSVWTSSLLEVLQQHPDVRLAHVSQFLWGATVVKPTGLLHFQMPHFCRDLYTRADLAALRPRNVAIGRDEHGVYRTAQHKEYPPKFCEGLAYTIIQNLAGCERQRLFREASPITDCLFQWLRGAERASSFLQRETWLPDFQAFP